MTSKRETVTIEFVPPDYERVADALAHLRDAGSGWINLLPGVPEGAVDVEPPTGLFAFFGNRQPPVTMATVMPARVDRSAVEGMNVGMMHPTGPKAVPRLADAGVTVPDGWTVRQDHARRGLVLRTSPASDATEIIDWCVRAGTELCLSDMTGEWRAVVYLP
jgi:hypothetical protein